jgi:hypothetical protein
MTDAELIFHIAVLVAVVWLIYQLISIHISVEKWLKSLKSDDKE